MADRVNVRQISARPEDDPKNSLAGEPAAVMRMLAYTKSIEKTLSDSIGTCMTKPVSTYRMQLCSAFLLAHLWETNFLGCFCGRPVFACRCPTFLAASSPPLRYCLLVHRRTLQYLVSQWRSYHLLGLTKLRQTGCAHPVNSTPRFQAMMK